MNYASIKPLDIADGDGVRVSLFVSGCPHRCTGCFNQETWDEKYGKPFTLETIEYILSLLSKTYVSGLTLLGGEPFTVPHQKALLPLIERVKKQYPQKTIWGYTGYLWQDLQPKGRAFCKATQNILKHLAVLVDGPFMIDKKEVGLKFRGSSNQRLIDVQQTLKIGRIVTL